MPYFIETQDGKFCVVKGTKESPEETVKCHKEHSDATAHMRALYAATGESDSDDSKKSGVFADNVTGSLMHGSGGILNPMRDGNNNKEYNCVCPKCGHTAKGSVACNKRQCPKCSAQMKEGDSEEKFISYKASDGTHRWLSVSSVAMLDQEEEIVTEKAYDDAISLAREMGLYGELDLVHVDDTDVGDCDMMTRLGPLLVEGGSWYTTERATLVRQAVEERLDYYGVSIKFRYDPEQFDGVRYNGGIQILKRTILPRTMAASFGTAIAVTGTGGKLMDEKTKEVLRGLNIPEDEITRLAEAQKSVEPNVKEKDTEEDKGVDTSTDTDVDKTTSEAGIRATFKSWLEDIFSSHRDEPLPDVVEGIDEVEDQAPAPVQEPAVPDPEPVLGDTNKAAQVFAEQMSDVLKGIIAPIVQNISALQEKFITLETRIVEAEKTVEGKVIERLNELPPVAKVAPTQVGVTVTPAITEAGPETSASVFMKSVVGLVKKAIADGDLKLQV